MSPSTHRPHRFRNVSYRWMRQIHLWIGAWGALATVVYGFTGLVLNHRFGDDAWPQGDSNEVARVELAVPATARTSAEALSLWLRDTQGLDAQTIRKGAPGGERGKSGQAGQRRGGDQQGQQALSQEFVQVDRPEHGADSSIEVPGWTATRLRCRWGGCASCRRQGLQDRSPAT